MIRHVGRVFARTIAALLCCALWTPARAVPQPEPTPANKPAAPAPRRGNSNLPEGVRTVKNLEYAEASGKKLLLDLYLPEAPADAPDATKAAAPEKPRPVVIWIHGGGWESGGRENAPVAYLVPHGYAGVSISYRLTGVAPFPAQIHDCKAAVRWVRAHAKEYGFDADHIGVWGASAGGHLAALMGTSGGDKDLEGDVGGNAEQSSRVQAVCDWFGPTDIVKLCRQAMALWNLTPKPSGDDAKPGTGAGTDGQPAAKPEETPKEKRDATPPIFKKLFGGELDDKLEVAQSTSPIKYVDKTDPAVLIMHGDKDPLVPLKQSEELRDALQAAGVSVELHVVKGGGHGSGFWTEEVREKILAFFDANLKGSDGVKK